MKIQHFYQRYTNILATITTKIHNYDVLQTTVAENETVSLLTVTAVWRIVARLTLGTMS